MCGGSKLNPAASILSRVVLFSSTDLSTLRIGWIETIRPDSTWFLTPHKLHSWETSHRMVQDREIGHRLQNRRFRTLNQKFQMKTSRSKGVTVKQPYSEWYAIVELGAQDGRRFQQSRQRCLDAGGCPECYCVPAEQNREHWKHCSKYTGEAGVQHGDKQSDTG